MSAARQKYSIGIFGQWRVGKTSLHKSLCNFYEIEKLEEPESLVIKEFPYSINDDLLKEIHGINIAFILCSSNDWASVNFSFFYRAIMFLADIDCKIIVVSNVHEHDHFLGVNIYARYMAIQRYQSDFIELSLFQSDEEIKKELEDKLPEYVKKLSC